ncbi:hypothetical protein SAVERM_1p91 (plasmid) [Streptomyces avermitilis MA-4680 = NBRC 14893]|uniref:Uncharacterized protein n=1 Tax=Streptomyces avermitilis (strain ATCC 31267 / DSM 46492 / JCM 5070 / NBRC 14893 / NCIMB 12804 / NRRL 8165 / MA-4680) TaxID=227882 RepID=Q82Y90_STRAW|nr:hypothetical protein SAVERM_1p91 [Streptomyces avermitilis MA-4680 = NBRC 14893]
MRCLSRDHIPHGQRLIPRAVYSPLGRCQPRTMRPTSSISPTS